MSRSSRYIATEACIFLLFVLSIFVVDELYKAGIAGKGSALSGTFVLLFAAAVAGIGLLVDLIVAFAGKIRNQG